MEVVKTSKGGDMLMYQGYSYVKKVSKNGYRRWSCSKARSQACPGAITTDELPFANPRGFKPHNHNVSLSEVEIQKCKSELKTEARNNYGARTGVSVATALQNLSPVAMANVGNLSAIKRDVQRQKARDGPVEPNSLATINIQLPWTSTGGQHPVPFLFHDSGPQDPQRMLLFATDECLQHLATSNEWYMDGTFKQAPNLFMQLYAIRTKLDDGAVSCVYALLCGKAKQTYDSMFAAIIQRCHALNLFPGPVSVHVDFEMAVHNSVRAMFGPLVNICGCYYHLCQSTWRKIQDLGLAVLYNQDDDVKKFVGMVDGLAILPINDIAAGVAVLNINIPDPRLGRLFTYFLDTYIGVWLPNANGQLIHRPPLFPLASWNVYTITLNNGSRTNNICEGWNNLVGQAHPPLYKLIQAMQRDNAIVRTQMAQSANGNPHRTSVKRSYLTHQTNLRQLCQRYNQGQYANAMQEYLESISHSIRF